MCKVISISSQKGGTGKTSSCINIGAALAKEGKRVLLVDNDPQGHLTIGLGFDKRQKVTLKTILENCIEEQELQVEEAILHHEEKLDLIPANKSLGIMNVYLSSIPEGETILRDVLDTIRSRYDYIIIDCGPSIGMLSINALTASDSVIIPVELDKYAVDGMEEMIRTVYLVRQKYNPSICIGGVLYNKVEARLNNSKGYREALEKTYGSRIPIFRTSIPKTVRVQEAANAGISILAYEPKNECSGRYMQLIREVEGHE